MDSRTPSRRTVLTYIGAGAVASSVGVFGITQFTETTAAQVALDFDNTTVELPEDDTIDDLRITGDVSGDFDTGAGPSEVVLLNLDVQFDRFGEFSESVERNPEQSQGSVSWQPTYSLVEQTDFTGEGDDLQSASFDNNTVSYDVTAGVEIEVYADGFLVAEAQDAATGTITFRDPSETGGDNGSDNNDDDTATPEASVAVSFGFEVDK